MPDSLNKRAEALVAEGNSLRRTAMKGLFLIPRLLYKLWFALVFLVSLLVLYIPFRVLLRRPSGYPAAFRLMRAWGKCMAALTLVPLRVQGEHRLPPPPYIVCLNHGSYLDIIHTFNVLPQYFLFIGKQELQQWPLFNIFFKDMHIAVNRDNGMEAARALMKAGHALDRGVSVSIFPEGTIPDSAPRMLPFKDGAFRLAVKKQVPIVPVTFLDNWKLLGDPHDPWSRARPGIARVVVHPAVHTRGLGPEDVDTLRRQVFAIVEGPLIKEYPAQ